jgi:hypothetical protein
MQKAAPSPSLVSTGCYLIRFQPDPPDPAIEYFEGTLRIIRNQNDELRAAGDLYCKKKGAGSAADILKLPTPPQGKLHVFARDDYRAYLKVKSLLENAPCQGQFTVRFDVHYFDARAQRWPQPGSRMMILSPAKKSTKGQASKASHPKYLGNVIDEETGRRTGMATVQFVSKFLRAAHVSLHAVPKVSQPDGLRIKKLFTDLKWALSVEGPKGKVKGNLPPNRPWTIAELHKLLERVRGTATAPDELDAKLDKEWLYYLLFVPTIEGGFRGVMFDTYGSDSNNVPREAAAIAGHQTFPGDPGDPGNEIWGAVKSKMLQEEAEIYARVALHELGHAMGLDHNHRDNGIMNTTDVIAENAQQTCQEIRTTANQTALESMLAAVKPDGTLDASWPKTMIKNRQEAKGQMKEFPANIKLSFHPEDAARLQLGPDIAVRPGTLYESGGPFYDGAGSERSNELLLEVVPLLETVPLGAPVRVGLRLRNTGGTRQRVPAELSLSSGAISGTVTDRHGEVRTFWPLKRNMDSDKARYLEPGATSETGSMTLLRGAQGALFPVDGDYRIVVTVSWAQNETSFFVEGEATMHVSPAVDDVHRALARGLLDSPDALLNLALGLRIPEKEPAHVIKAACQHAVLRPHFAVIMAKQEATPYFTEHEDLDAACRWIDETTVLSGAEIKRLAKLFRESGKSGSEPCREAFKLLKTKVTILLRSGRIGPIDAAAILDPKNGSPSVNTTADTVEGQ